MQSIEEILQMNFIQPITEFEFDIEQIHKTFYGLDKSYRRLLDLDFVIEIFESYFAIRGCEDYNIEHAPQILSHFLETKLQDKWVEKAKEIYHQVFIRFKFFNYNIPQVVQDGLNHVEPIPSLLDQL